MSHFETCSQHKSNRFKYCDFCDGCGWHEGGKTLMTDCHVCKGHGIVTGDNQPLDSPEQVESLKLHLLKLEVEMSTSFVMGFEFDSDSATAIRQNDLALRVLADLQEHGVAKVSKTEAQYLPELNALEGEYWTEYINERESEIVYVVHEIEKVYSG